MRKTIWTALFCLIATAALAQAPATVTVADTIYKADGTTFNGTLTITWPGFISPDSKAINAGTKSIAITSGVLSTALVPTVGATPVGVSYAITYSPGGKQVWVVPASGPVNLSQVVAAVAPSPIVSFAPSQVQGTAVVRSPTGTQTITAPILAGAVPLQVKGNATAAADVLDIYDSAGSPAKQSYFDSNGALNTAKQVTSTVSTGSAPLVVASTTKVTNLNADALDGTDWTAPGAIGGTTPGTGAFTSLAAGSAKWNVDTNGLETKSNNLTLAGQGKGLILGATSQKSETTSADTNVLTVTPASAVGTYCAHVAISVSSATSGVISWTLSWTDSNGNAQSNVASPLFQLGTAAPNTTFTTSAAGNYEGVNCVDVDNSGTAIVVKWVGGGTTAAKMSAWIDRII